MSIDAAVRPAGGLKRALVFSSSGTAGARLTGAIGGLLAARLLGPAGRGRLAILVFLATAASMAAAAGIQFWTAREVARDGGVRGVGSVVRVHALVMTVVVVLVGAATAGMVGALAQSSAVAVWLTIGVAVSNALQLLVLAVPNGLRAMGIVAVALVGAGAVYVGATASLLALDRASLSLVLAGMVVGNVFSILLVLRWVRRAPPGRAEPARRGTAYRRALRFGAPAGGGELVLLAMLRVDVLIVAAFLPLRDVGLYAVATALSEVLWIVPDGVAQVVLPTTASSPSESRTPRLIRVTLAATAVLGCLLVLLARPVVSLAFGPSFHGTAAAIPFLVVASLAGGVWKIVGSEIVALGRSTPRLWSALAGLAVMLVVDLAAVPAMGISGAAFGSALGYATAAAVVTRSWSHEVGRPSTMLLGFRPLDVVR